MDRGDGAGLRDLRNDDALSPSFRTARDKIDSIVANVELRPNLSRISILFVASIAAIGLPVGLMFYLGMNGPSPYLLDRSQLGEEWIRGARQVNGVTLWVRELQTPEDAVEQASQLAGTIPISSRRRLLNEVRYVRADNQRSGLLFPIDSLVIQLEGEDQEALDRAIEAIPFLSENPEKNVVYVLFSEHLPWVLGSIGLYMLVYMVAICRGSAWASRVVPPGNVIPLPKEELRARLLALNDFDLPFHILEGKRGRLVAEWRLVDAKWSALFERGRMKMAHSVAIDLEGPGRIARTLDRQYRLHWSATVGRLQASAFGFRGISFFQSGLGKSSGIILTDKGWRPDTAYKYRFNLNELKQPLVQAIVSSGWAYQPVASFIRVIGG